MSFTSVGNPSPVVSGERTGRGACAETRAGSGWLCGWTAVGDTSWTTVPVCLLRAWQAL